MSDLSALARKALEYLAARERKAWEASTIATDIGVSLPKTQAALNDLRVLGLVSYHRGHPGCWSVTATGYGEINVATASVDRYRMALEAIVLTADRTFNWEVVEIAKTALGTLEAKR